MVGRLVKGMVAVLLVATLSVPAGGTLAQGATGQPLPLPSNSVAVEQQASSTTAKLTLEVDAERVAPGAQVHLAVKLADVQGLYGIQLKLAYDKDHLKVTEVVYGELFAPFVPEQCWTRAVWDDQAGVLEYAASLLQTTETVSGNGSVAVITFQALPTVEPGDYRAWVKLTDGDLPKLSDRQAQPIACEPQPTPVEFVVDSLPPVTKASVDPAQPDGDPVDPQQAAGHRWYRMNPRVALATEAGATTYWWLDDGEPQEYAEPVIIPDGAHRLTYYSVDAVGNQEAPQHLYFWVDTVPPRLTSVSHNASTTILKEGQILQVTLQGDPGLRAYFALDGGQRYTAAETETAGTYAGSYTVTDADERNARVTAILRDQAGNESSLDAAAPALLDGRAPRLTITQEYPSATAGARTVRGTYEDLNIDRVELQVGDQVVAATLAPGARAGTGTFFGTVNLAHGCNQVVARGFDKLGHVGTQKREIIVDLKPPTLQITAPTNGQQFGAGTIDVTAHAEDDTAIDPASVLLFVQSVMVDGTSLPQRPLQDSIRVSPSADGKSADITVTLDSCELGDGTHTVSMTVADVVGNVSSAAQVSFHVDCLPPATSALVSPESPGLNGWYTTRPTVTLTTESGGTIHYALDVPGQQELTGSEVGSCTVDIPDGDGITLTFWSVDTAGNEESLRTLTFRVDTARPDAPAITAITSDKGVTVVDGVYVTRGRTVTVSGTAEARAIVGLRLDGTRVAESRADDRGQFVFEAVAIPQGDHVLTARAVDQAGNAGDLSTEVRIRRDSAGPTIAVSVAEGAAANGAIPVTVYATMNEEVDDAVYMKAVFAEKVVTDPEWQPMTRIEGSRTFRATFNRAEGSGQLSISVRAHDLLGNQGVGVYARATIGSAGGTVETETVRVQVPAGQLEQDHTMTVRVSDQPPLEGTDALSSTDISAESEHPAVTLQFKLPVDDQGNPLDAAGNPVDPAQLAVWYYDETQQQWVKLGGTWQSPYLSVEVEHLSTYAVLADTVPPVLEVRYPADGALVNSAQLDVRLTTEAGARVEITGDVVTTTSVDGTGSEQTVSVRLSGGDGTKDLVVTAQDPAGNKSSVNLKVTLDQTPPDLRLTLPTGVAPGATVGTRLTPIRIEGSAYVAPSSGTVDTTAVVVLKVDGSERGRTSGGTFAWDVPLPSDRTYAIELEATDAAGNRSTYAFSVERKTGGPVLTLTTPADGSFVNTDAVTVSGVSDTGVTVIVESEPGGFQEELTVGQSGSFSLTVPVRPGLNTIRVTARDALGNVTVTTVKVTVDKDPPPLVVDPLPASGAGSVTVSGTSEYGVTVEVAVSCAGRFHSHRQVAGVGGRFSLSATLYVGDNLILVRATDRAGNLTLAGPYPVRGLAPPPAAPPGLPPVVLPAPKPPVLEALPRVVHEASLVLEGTATAGGTVEFRLNGQVVGTAVVGSDGRFRFTVSLREGLNVVQVRVRTAAGWSEYTDARLVRYVVLREMKDIAGHWAEGAIKKAVGMGIVAGYEDGTFRPDKRVLRMEFAKIIALALDLNIFAAAEPVEYLDWVRVPAWARPYIAACVQAGLIQGYDGTIAAGDEVTRVQIAAILVRAMGLDSLARQKMHERLPFRDDDQIPFWARGYLAVAVERGLLEGAEGLLRPNDTATRAEALTMVLRFLGEAP